MDPWDVLSRPRPPPDATVRYGAGPDHLVDIHLPARSIGVAARPGPLVVVLHGGFWRAGYDRRHTRALAADLARRGFVVAAPEYRRTGSGGGWPTTFDDVAAAVDAAPRLVEEVAPGRLDRRLLLLGHSAGGQLALWAAARHRLPTSSPWHRERPSGLLGVVAVAAVTALAEAARCGLGDGAVDALLGGAAHRAERLAQVDPVALLPSGVPVVAVHGDADQQVPVNMTRRFAALAVAAGDDVQTVELPGTEHFAPIDPRSAAWPAVTRALGRLARPAT